MHAKRELYIFAIYYAIVYMTISIFGSYISVYYLSKGFSVFQIGMLQAIGPVSSLFILPMWAAASDRVRYKTTILKTVIIGSICAVVLYRQVSGFYATIVVTMMFMTFYTSIISLGDAIAVDRIIRLNGKFTSVRLWGTLSFALTVILAGSYFRNHITNMFYVAAVFLFLDFLIVCFFRKEKAVTEAADAAKAEKQSFMDIFKNKSVVFLLLFCLMMSVAFSFNSTFIGVYIKNMHYSSFYIGLAMCISAASEVPILLCIQRRYVKFGAINILIFSGFMMGLRMLILFFASNIAMVLLSQVLQGVTYMTLHYSTIMFMNEHAPWNMKSTSQSLLAVFQAGFGSILGSIGGGYFCGRVGISATYGYFSASLFILTLICACSVTYMRKKRKFKH